MTSQTTKYLLFENKTDPGHVLAKELNAPSKGQVLIRVSASSVQSADLFMLTGKFPGLKFPITTGYDVVGIISQVGTDISDFNAGDRVAYMSITGGHSEYILADASHVVKLGTELGSIPDAQITSLTLSWMTAYQILNREPPPRHGTEPRSILVQGGWGATGRPTIALAVAAGDTVYTTVRSEEQARIMENDFGVKKAFLYKDPKYIQELREATGGKGVDLVLDGIGVNSFADSKKCLSSKGYLVAYGVHSSVLDPKKQLSVFKLVTSTIWMKLTSRKGFTFYSIAERRKKKPEEWKEDFGVLLGMLKEGKIQIKIAETLHKLEDVHAAHEKLLKGDVDGKIVLKLPAA